MNIKDYKLAKARSLNTSSEELDDLIIDDDKYVVYTVSDNPNLSLETLAKLCTHPSDIVRCNIARQINVPPIILSFLADDSNWEVRYEVARNHNTPIDILDKLRLDRDYDVFKMAQARYSALNKINEL